MAIANPGGEIAVHKMPGPAWNFIKHNATDGFLKQFLRDNTEIVLLHTRFYTVGDPTKNVNNHPLFDGKTAVIHNGSIRNHEEMFRGLQVERKAETDSDVIRAIFDKEGFTETAVRQIARGCGSGAIAAVSPDHPGMLALGRSGNPLVLADFNDKLYFASELKAIHKAVRPYTQRHGFWLRERTADFAYNNMQDHTMYFSHPDGSLTHHEMRIATSFIAPVYKSHENYAERMRTWKQNNKPTRIFCKCPECGTVQSKHEATPWTQLVCGNQKCKADLSKFEKVAAA
jgi:glucosamine 6-phosphate synthetase-like amidotransferase/phosphosugar isomerase protein